MEEIQITKDDRILVLSPHPDDESIGIGGLLSKYGAQSDVWVLTDGSKCKMYKDKSEIIKTRKKEFITAMELLSILDYRFFDVEDKTLENELDMLDNMNISKYTKIFIPSCDEKHIDHISTYRIAINMIERQKFCGQVYTYEITNPMQQYDSFLNITDVIELKKNVIKEYSSQIQIFDYVNAAISLNKFRSCMLGEFDSFVEVFNSIDIEVATRKNIVKDDLDKQLRITKVLNEWIKLEKEREGIEKILLDKKIKSISIYGYGILGKTLCYMLKDSKIEIKAIIDKKNKFSEGINITTEQEFPQTDAIIVTAVMEFETIEEKLKNKVNTKIISLEKIIYEAMVSKSRK